MPSNSTRARLLAISAIAGALLAPTADAADMPYPLAPEPIVDAPVEFGSGWYLRGDIGPAHVGGMNVEPALVSTSLANNWTVGVGGGYQYNSWFRTEITADYSPLYQKSSYRSVLNTGLTAVDIRAEATTFLASAYIDLGCWWGVTPYIGAGAGANVYFKKDQVAGGTAYADITYLRAAWAAMGGFAYDVTDHIKFDIGYRFVNLGTFSGYNYLYNTSFSRNVFAHQVRVGFRYMID